MWFYEWKWTWKHSSSFPFHVGKSVYIAHRRRPHDIIDIILLTWGWYCAVWSQHWHYRYSLVNPVSKGTLLLKLRNFTKHCHVSSFLLTFRKDLWHTTALQAASFSFQHPPPPPLPSPPLSRLLKLLGRIKGLSDQRTQRPVPTEKTCSYQNGLFILHCHDNIR